MTDDADFSCYVYVLSIVPYLMISEHPRGGSTAEASEEAFARFVQRYANLVFSIARRRLGNSSLAEDVTQSVFVRISQTPPPIKDEAGVVAWLHRVTTNAAIDAWRSECRRREREQAALPMQNYTPCQSDGDAELAQCLDEALNELRASDRRAILLRYIRGHSMAEVGRLLGTSEDAAKMRVHRALDFLRHKLATRGVTCASGVLLAFLMDRAIEAAPAKLTLSLARLKGGDGWNSETQAATIPIAFKAAIIAVLVACVLLAVSKPPNALPSAIPPAIQVGANARAAATTSSLPAEPRNSLIGLVEASVSLTVTDFDTKAGIPGARIRALYFNLSGSPERQVAITDRQGTAELPRPRQMHVGAINLFVTAPNYVPMCFRWEYATVSHLDASLKAARTVAGTIHDEQGATVMNASIQLRGPSMDDPQQNPSFHHEEAIVLSDGEGRYILPYVPKDWSTLKIRSTKENYAMTDVDIPMTNQNLSKVDLVLKCGVVLAGSVMTTEDTPILGATIRELSNWGVEPPHTETDGAGQFALRGVWKHSSVWPFEVIVQAEKFRPEIRVIELISSTNWAHFKLSKGILFNGRVRDEAGDPISGAAVGTAPYPASEGLDRYRWVTNTDRQGMFQWTSAPAVETMFYFEASGFVTKRKVIIPNDQFQDIELIRLGDRAR